MKNLVLFLFLCTFLSSLDKEKTSNRTNTITSPNLDTCQITAWHLSSKVHADSVYDVNIKNPEQEVQLKDRKVVKVTGYFHQSELRIPTIKNEQDGFTIIKPFSYLREKSHSVGSPVWFGFNAILVNIGWIPKACTIHDFKNKTFLNLKSPISIYGYNNHIESIDSLHLNPSLIFENQQFDIPLLWESIFYQIRHSKMSPPGGHHIYLYLDMMEFQNE